MDGMVRDEQKNQNLVEKHTIGSGFSVGTLKLTVVIQPNYAAWGGTSGCS